MSEMIRYIGQLADRISLSEEEASRVFQIILMGGATPAQMAALLMGLRLKGETVEELTGAALALRAKSGKIEAPDNALDTCGTGGDHSGSLNISTAVAFVVAACGVPVAKHGNRAISSRSGSADVLAQLGVNVEVEPEVMERALRRANICFMMAPKFHSAMRHVAPVRQELGIRTIFNLLGPLANPASTRYQLLGVYSKEWVLPMAKVLQRLGSKRAWVVHGMDGLDELTTTDATLVAALDKDGIREFTVTPEELAIERVSKEDLMGGDVQYNARELHKLLSGKGERPYRDVVLLNAAASLVVAERVSSLIEGMSMAGEALDSGRAKKVLEQLVEITNLAGHPHA